MSCLWVKFETESKKNWFQALGFFSKILLENLEGLTIMTLLKKNINLETLPMYKHLGKQLSHCIRKSTPEHSLWYQDPQTTIQWLVILKITFNINSVIHITSGNLL